MPATRCSCCVSVIVLMLYPYMVTAQLGANMHTQDYVPVLDCDRDGYKQCGVIDKAAVSFIPIIAGNNMCCGEGFENNAFLECNKCPQGKYKGGSNLYDKCSECPTGTMQTRTGCRSCDFCTNRCISSLQGLSTDTSLDITKNEFELKTCRQPHDECLPQRHTSPCLSNRLTVAVMPEGWTTLQGSDTTCSTDEVHKCIVLRADSHTEYQTLPETCLEPTSQACVHNAESYSWLPCSLATSDNCEPVATVLNAFHTADQNAADSPASAIWHAIPYRSDFSLVMRVPDEFELTVTLFTDAYCTDEIPGSVKTSSSSERKLVWPTSGNEFFRIAIAAESTHRCSCDPGVGAGEWPLQSDGVAVTSVTCGATCAKGQILKHIENLCDFDFKWCEWCDRHHQQDDTKEKCVRCPNEQPHRDVTAEECRACYDYEYFKWPAYTPLPGQGCTELMNMTVDTFGNITHTVDEYRSGPFEKSPPPPGTHRKNMSSAEACDETSKTVCNETGTYLHGCIGRIPGNGQFYVQTTSVQGIDIVHFETAFAAPQAQYTNVDVWRQGLCRPCTQCMNDQYLDGCVVTDSDHNILPGVGWEPHPENQGTCKPCGNTQDLMADMYFWHPQPGNCSGWPEEMSTMPFQQGQCAAVILSRNQDRVFLSGGCHRETLRWWSDERVTSSDTGDVRSVPGTRTCSVGSSGADCAIPDKIGIKSPSTTLTWSAYAQDHIRHLSSTEFDEFSSGGGTARVAYCPPGWRVDLECATSLGTAQTLQWNAECCRECRECRSEQREKRGQHWMPCDGSTTADTQSFCQASCDVGYYEKEKSDATGNYSSCTPCELC